MTPERENGIPEEAREHAKEHFLETAHEEVSWSPGNRVFLTIDKNFFGGFDINFHIENEISFEEQTGKIWSEAKPERINLPTVKTRDRVAAMKRAQEALADRENWITL